jgi:uncharacterized protein YbjQ (UPF0145 family)
MLVTTTHSVQGMRIVAYYGLVSGEAIMGAHIGKDFLAGITNLIGGRSTEYEAELRRAKEIALDEMQQQAISMGANAVIGVDLDYEAMGSSSGMLMVSACGTAVRIEQL